MSQKSIFDKGEWWEDEWQDMPEFAHEDLQPYQTIYVHFEDRKAMEDFSQLVGQKIGINTISIWFPQAEIGTFADKKYVTQEPRNES